MAGLKLEVGKTYRNKLGREYKIVFCDLLKEHPYKDHEGDWYDSTGRFACAMHDSDFNLVEEVCEFDGSVQVGGSHYTSMKIQPYEYITQNNLGWDEGNIIKYVSRWRSKNGLEDLKKAQDYLNKLIQREEQNA